MNNVDYSKYVQNFYRKGKTNNSLNIHKFYSLENIESIKYKQAHTTMINKRIKETIDIPNLCFRLIFKINKVMSLFKLRQK